MIEPNPAQLAMTGGLQIGSVQDGEQMRRILLRFTDFADNSPEKLKHQLIFLFFVQILAHFLTSIQI